MTTNNGHGIAPLTVDRIIRGEYVQLLITSGPTRDEERRLEKLRIWITQIRAVQMGCLTTKSDGTMEMVVRIKADALQYKERLALAGQLQEVPFTVRDQNDK